MPKPTRDAMTCDGIANGFRHDQTDLGCFVIDGPGRVHDEVGLSSPHSPFDRQPEVRRPRHPVPNRKHVSIPCCGSRTASRSERATALAAPTGNDGAPGTGTHAQPEAVHTCTTTVVRLKGPLALGHGCYSSVDCRVGILHRHDVVIPVRTQAQFVRTSVSLASPGAVPRASGSQPCRHIWATVRGY